MPKSCIELGATCGSPPNGCGQTIWCGTCVFGTCGSDFACHCPARTCAEAKAECGRVADGCGNTLDCGTCAVGACGADLACHCTPRTCAEAKAQCGQVSDGCGGTLECGSCGDRSVCGGDHACHCTPRTCDEVNASCGMVEDGCGQLLSCGSCGREQRCGQADAGTACAADPSNQGAEILGVVALTGVLLPGPVGDGDLAIVQGDGTVRQLAASGDEQWMAGFGFGLDGASRAPDGTIWSWGVQWHASSMFPNGIRASMGPDGLGLTTQETCNDECTPGPVLFAGQRRVDGSQSRGWGLMAAEQGGQPEAFLASGWYGREPPYNDAVPLWTLPPVVTTGSGHLVIAFNTATPFTFRGRAFVQGGQPSLVLLELAMDGSLVWSLERAGVTGMDAIASGPHDELAVVVSTTSGFAWGGGATTTGHLQELVFLDPDRQERGTFALDLSATAFVRLAYLPDGSVVASQSVPKRPFLRLERVQPDGARLDVTEFPVTSGVAELRVDGLATSGDQVWATGNIYSPTESAAVDFGGTTEQVGSGFTPFLLRIQYP